ncbi:hypothetical protein [Rhodovibrio salinarum]|uniref:Uncharacterized protein n=1 Tax=Rhodovibrio salinarum TaxID=1087 RepID=A0A934V252_9PROT|nr:hypothetical protein [Rhodovibrio salinarum]MBK1699055.1 hypothetical protein [Rhodovibrio salinarum]
MLNRRIAPTAWLYLAVYLLTLVDALRPTPVVAGIAAVGLMTFVILQAPAIRMPQRIAAAVLITAGLAAAWSRDGSAGALADLMSGAERALPFMVLFAAVMCLQVPALASPSFRQLGERVVAQPPGRRFLMLAFAGHYLGAVLNLAGLQLVASLLDPDMRPRLRRRLTLAVVRGFSGAVMWSPFFVGMGVILTVVPDVSWLQLAPAGLAIGSGLVGLAWALDRTTRGPRDPRGDRPAPPEGKLGRGILGVLTIFATLTASVVALSEGAGLSIVISLGLIAPTLSIVWAALLRRTGAAEPAPVLSSVVTHLPGLRNEAALFLAATVFAVGVSHAVQPDAVAGSLGLADWPSALRAAVLAVTGTFLGGLGIHPVVLAILVGDVLGPAALGLSPLAVALLLAVIWGMGTQMSPFSATVMHVSRMLDVSVFRVAWLWNAPYCLPAAALAGTAVAGVAALLG